MTVMAPAGARRRILRHGLAAITVAWPMAQASAVPETEALLRPAIKIAAPGRASLLAAAWAGRRLVAVGERGIVLLSEDDGVTWRQAQSPVSVTLTAMCFANATHGVAVGHGGVVMTTADGGATWAVRLDGRRAAEILKQDAVAAADTRAVAEAERLVAEGPDKPFLDVQCGGNGQIRIVGAYGLAFRSDDGGQHWQSWGERLDNPKALHYYALRERGQVVLIAGEQGMLLRSDDGGATFKRLASPYRGSFFTAELPADHEIFVAGLRGNVWDSLDDGRSWRNLPVADGASITASVVQAQGGLLLADQAGFVLRVSGGRTEAINAASLPPINAIVATGPGRVLALTARGPVAVDSTPPR